MQTHKMLLPITLGLLVLPHFACRGPEARDEDLPHISRPDPAEQEKPDEPVVTGVDNLTDVRIAEKNAGTAARAAASAKQRAKQAAREARDARRTSNRAAEDGDFAKAADSAERAQEAAAASARAAEAVDKYASEAAKHASNAEELADSKHIFSDQDSMNAAKGMAENARKSSRQTKVNRHVAGEHARKAAQDAEQAVEHLKDRLAASVNQLTSDAQTAQAKAADAEGRAHIETEDARNKAQQAVRAVQQGDLARAGEVLEQAENAATNTNRQSEKANDHHRETARAAASINKIRIAANEGPLSALITEKLEDRLAQSAVSIPELATQAERSKNAAEESATAARDAVARARNILDSVKPIALAEKATTAADAATRQEESCRQGLQKAREARKQAEATAEEGDITATRENLDKIEKAADEVQQAAEKADQKAATAADKADRVGPAAKEAERNLTDNPEIVAQVRKATRDAADAKKRAATARMASARLSELTQEEVRGAKDLLAKAAANKIEREQQRIARMENEIKQRNRRIQEAKNRTAQAVGKARNLLESGNIWDARLAAREAREAAGEAREGADKAKQIAGEAANGIPKLNTTLSEFGIDQETKVDNGTILTAIEEAERFAEGVHDAAEDAERMAAIAEKHAQEILEAIEKGEAVDAITKGFDIDQADIPERPPIPPDTRSRPEGVVEADPPLDDGIEVRGRWKQVCESNGPDFLPGGYNTSILAFRADAILEVHRKFGDDGQFTQIWRMNYTWDVERQKLELGTDPEFRPPSPALKGFRIEGEGIRVIPPRQSLPVALPYRREEDGRVVLDGKTYEQLPEE